MRSQDWAERSIAARAVGGAGDLRHTSELRALAESDPSSTVRCGAIEGLTHLVGGDSVPDLWRAAKDTDEMVRANAGVFAFRLARRTADEQVQSEVRKLLATLAGDYAPSVSAYAQDLLRQIETH